MKKIIVIIILFALCSGISFTWAEWNYIEKDLNLIWMLKGQGKTTAEFSTGTITTTADGSGIVFTSPSINLNLTWQQVQTYNEINEKIQRLHDIEMDTLVFIHKAWNVGYGDSGVNLTPN